MKDPQVNKSINSELTEEELSKIFLGADTDTTLIVDPPAATISEEQPAAVKKPKHAGGRPRIEKPKKEEKRAWGRPKVWTPEKILQLKAEKKKAAAQRREEKADQTQLSKISTNIPLTMGDKQKILDQNIKTKEDIEKHVLETRTNIKAAIEQQANKFMYTKSICKKHKYKLNYFENGEVVSDCIYCSSIKRCSLFEWDRLDEKV